MRDGEQSQSSGPPASNSNNCDGTAKEELYRELQKYYKCSEKIKAIISDYKEYNTDTTVKFTVTINLNQMADVEKEGLHKVFKLQSVITTSSMCAFDELGCLRRFDSVAEILREFYNLRLVMYQRRKDYIEGMLEAEAAKLTNQARFIMEKCSGELTVENKKRKVIVDELIKRGYPPDPITEWKQRTKAEDEEELPGEEEEEAEVNHSTKKKMPIDPDQEFKKMSEVKKFDYLLGMSMWMLTEERKNELLRQKDQKLSELVVLKNKSKYDLWREDLDIFIEKLDALEEKERLEDLAAKKPVKTGKKKVLLAETMPSPAGRRIAPIISDDLKKRIQTAIKTKENKGKRTVKKENIADNEVKDEFDEMLQNKKSLKDKVGTPDEVEKKTKTKGLKQTKLNFKKREIEITSSSEDDAPPPRLDTTSEDMFDSLVGRKRVEDNFPPEETKRKFDDIISDSDDEFLVKPEKKPAAKTKPEGKLKPKRQTKRAHSFSSDSSEKEVYKPKSKKKTSKDDSDEDFEDDATLEDMPLPNPTTRVARNVKRTKYVFDSDDSD